MSTFGGSPGLAYPGSRMGPETLDWPIVGSDPNDDWWQEAGSIASRSWHLWRANAYAVAMTKTMVEVTLGPTGLLPRSLFRGATQLDPSTDPDVVNETAKDVISQRSKIEKSLRYAWRGTRFDAIGALTKREMSEVMFLSCMVAGDAFAIRQWKPNRPGKQYQATCWRIVDPARVSNPSFGPNNVNLFEGIKLDDDGCKVGVYVQRRNPYAIQNVDFTWDLIPWHAPDGSLNVVHLKAPGRPDQIRGIGWFAPVMAMVHQLGQVTDAFVVAKRVQACIGYIETSPNQVASAAAQTNGATSRSPAGATNARLYPGMRLVVPMGTTITPLNWNFQGDDHSGFQDSMLQAICAAWAMPMEFVQHRLTKTNMAAARAALMQAYKTATCGQEMMIGAVETPWAESVLLEDDARGRISLPAGDMDDAMALRWNRPAQQYPDPVKEATAAEKLQAQGKSPSSLAAQRGDDFESEILQSAQDKAFAAAHGVAIAAPEMTAPVVAPDPDANQEDAEAPVPADEVEQ